MKKHLIALISAILLAAAPSAAEAQGIYFGVRGGMNLTSMTDRPNSKVKVGGNVGMFCGYQFSSVIGLQVEALYSFQGYFSGNIPVSREPLNSMICYDYIKVPVVAKFYLIKGLNLEAGVSFNFLVSSLGGAPPLRGMNSFDFSIPIGLAYQFGRHFEVGARYDISTVRVDPAVTGTNSVFSINVAWRF